MTQIQNTLSSLLAAGQLEPFITHIRFPKYKNLAPNTRIEFSHPITVLVGANGTNKSSVLRALYGVPGQYNLGSLWFSTSTDPIEEGDGERNCFIYGYNNPEAKKVTEVLKIRIKKDEDPDYWEPSRPYAKYDMEGVPKIGPIPAGATRTRWKTIKKEVIYIDFRAALSAFDKFFYYGELKKKNLQKEKKDFIRSRANHLKKALDSGLTSLNFRKSERIINSENRILDKDELDAISFILGRKYSEIKLIRHRFYNSDGYTAQLKTKDFSYTEAFAGSGEFSVIKLVTSIVSCDPKTLILLDEPEVSIHPGAQERLMYFLSEQVKKHKHQIVISTHSPAIIRILPPSAIKVLAMDGLNGKISVLKQESLPEEAFFHLGEPVPGKITVVVEDRLAKAVVEKSLRVAGEAIFNMFEIVHFPGGSDTLWTHYLPIFAAENREDIVVYMDGDQQAVEENRFIDPNTVPIAENYRLSEIIKAATGSDVSFPVDSLNGKGNEEQLFAARRQYIRWCKTYVDYLPSNIPEEFVWRKAPSDVTSAFSGSDYKNLFFELTKHELKVQPFEKVSSDDILQTQKRLLAQLDDNDQDLVNIREALVSFLKH
ncbi:ATP-dependent nuclease [Duganella sp. S19_KUP01_CR8]|uniref:ATP-dependent nuclease n=1 Tax=Duganella sp. S19_KUP01_CR8 TaxID=3025502 RepID=UPI002FCDA9FF